MRLKPSVVSPPSLPAEESYIQLQPTVGLSIAAATTHALPVVEHGFMLAICC